MPTETALGPAGARPARVRRYALKTAAPQRKDWSITDRDLSDEQRAVALCEPRPTLVHRRRRLGPRRARSPTGSRT